MFPRALLWRPSQAERTQHDLSLNIYYAVLNRIISVICYIIHHWSDELFKAKMYTIFSNTQLQFIKRHQFTVGPIIIIYDTIHRGHVNKKKFQKSKKTLEVGGWVKCPIGKKNGKHISIHYSITFLGEHSNVNDVINALLCLCYCFHVQVFVVNYF